MEKKIILEGFTLSEFLEEVTVSVRKAIHPSEDQLISRSKAAKILGMDSRTLTRAMEFTDVKILTTKSVENIRKNYRKNSRH